MSRADPESKKDGRGGKRPSSGRPPHPLGAGVKVSVMVPRQIWREIQAEAKARGVSFSRALVDRLIRGGSS